jgi:NEDD8-activating enzyme E1 regulatory subunit
MNYTEAIANAHRAFAPVSIPDNIQEIFSSPFMNESLQADSSSFRILLHCLQLFIESHGNGVLCPLKGSIPDMTSTSEHYVNLQQVYFPHGPL